MIILFPQVSIFDTNYKLTKKKRNLVVRQKEHQVDKTMAERIASSDMATNSNFFEQGKMRKRTTDFFA